MKILNVIVVSLMMSVLALAADRSVYFAESPSKGFCASDDVTFDYINSQGQLCSDWYASLIRFLAIDPPSNSSTLSGYDLERPFLIVDGIYLGTSGMRSLWDFKRELGEIGMFDILQELGYTPVLVQMSETVGQSLQENGESFSKMLKFMTANKHFGLTNPEDGFVVMGISQGGVLGRYGSYLYDKNRAKTDPPIRMYVSLDSPHQGAVLPLGLYYTLDFWATEGGSAAAETFRDMIDGPGASGLLLYDYKMESGKRQYYVNTASDRFLFGEYRKAAEYKGFPTVLLAEGQLKGTTPEHASEYFKLNRYAEKAWTVWGRAESDMASYTDGNSEISFNRVYKKWDFDERDTRKDAAKYDFVQGSTYPFAETIYSSLRQGFEDALPDGMTKTIGLFSVELSTQWDDDTLMQGSSTFIPTVSAMDLNCGGDLAIKGECAFTQNSTDFPFTNPGSRSSADVVYAVDPTHPRYNEAISGRHVELPCEDESTCLYRNVVNGLRVDLWRMLCELANLNYDENTKMYANEKLAGYFVPGTNCLDQSRIPILIHTFGLARTQGFAYSRYMYNSDATEMDEEVSFDVPAGWHKVSMHDMGRSISDGSIFEVEVRVNRSNGNWMKAELLLTKGKNGASQLQMKEIEIPMDGEFHRIRWNMPMSSGAMANYRWFTVVLNSEGSNVTVRAPHALLNNVRENVPTETVASQIYPGDLYNIYPWTEDQSVSAYSDALGSGLELKYDRIGGGIVVDFGELMSLEAYSNLKLTFWPGTCSGTGVYFDSYKKGLVKIGTGNMEGNFAVTEVPLDEIINTLYTPEYTKAASRLVFENISAGERCLIRSIQLK